MRARNSQGNFMRGAIAIVLAFSSSLAFASAFGKDKTPLPQWALDAARTHTPDYAKDASAVVLFDEYVESVDGQGRAVERRRKVTRILKPQGRRNPCAIGYDVDEKINVFRAWTIAADEKQYQARENDFVEVGESDDPIMLMTGKIVVANPPAVDVGATVVCESEEWMPPYDQEKIWHMQEDDPIVFEALEVDLPVDRKMQESWHRHDPVKPQEVSPNHWRWEVTDTPALTLRGVPSAPEWIALAGRMSVQWGNAAVEGRDQQWQAIGQWFTDLEATRPDPSPEITAKVQELIAGAPDFFTKVTRITESIQKDIRYFIVMRGIGGLQANHASDIFRNRYGDCKDKTTLLISMLQVAGIHAVYMPVDTHRGVVDPVNPSQIGNHMITAIEVPADVNDPRLQAVVKAHDGKRYLIFDPTNERTPAGNLPSYLQGGYGILCAGASSQVMALPVLAPSANGTVESGSFTLTADGTLTGTLDTLHSGPEGANYRLLLKETDATEQRKFWETRVARDLPGVELTSFQLVQPPALEKPLELHYRLTDPQYAHQAGTLLLVRPRVVGSHLLPFDDKPRTLPIDLSATGHWHDSFDITLPPGYVVDETPDPINVDVDFASYKSSIAAVGNQLHYERDYTVREVEIPADKAAAFRRLESAIMTDEKGTAVLKKQ